MARPAKIKDEFADLEGDWKDGIVGMADEEINKKIAEVAKGEEENQKAKKEDPHLQEARAACKVAGEGYKEATKMAKLRIRYCMRVLGDRGKE